MIIIQQLESNELIITEVDPSMSGPVQCLQTSHGKDHLHKNMASNLTCPQEEICSNLQAMLHSCRPSLDKPGSGGTYAQPEKCTSYNLPSLDNPGTRGTYVFCVYRLVQSEELCAVNCSMVKLRQMAAKKSDGRPVAAAQSCIP